MTHAGIAVDAIGAGLDLIPKDKLQAILMEFPRLSMKTELKVLPLLSGPAEAGDHLR